MSQTGLSTSLDKVKGVAPESEIDSQFNQLFSALSELDQRVGTLGVRLEPVLTPYASGETGQPDSAVRSLSPVADRVRSAMWSVQSLTARVDAILGSLAV